MVYCPGHDYYVLKRIMQGPTRLDLTSEGGTSPCFIIVFFSSIIVKQTSSYVLLHSTKHIDRWRNLIYILNCT